MKILNKIQNIFTYPIRVCEEFYGLYLIVDSFKKEVNQELINSSAYELRIDWLGRIYTVVDVPEQYFQIPIKDREMSIQSYVLKKLSSINSIMIGLGVNEILTPTISRVGITQYYKVELSNIWEYTGIIRLTYNSIFWYAIYRLFKYGNVLLLENGIDVVELLTKLVELI